MVEEEECGSPITERRCRRIPVIQVGAGGVVDFESDLVIGENPVFDPEMVWSFRDDQPERKEGGEVTVT